MSTLKRTTFIFLLASMTSVVITGCDDTQAATTAGASDQAHNDHDNLLRAHDAKLGDKSTPGSLIALTSKLSDDIGLMANRILVMADKILIMSDNIVKVINSQTQASQDVIKLGADIALKIDTINASGTSGVTLTAPVSGSAATVSAPPVITYNNTTGTTRYQLLVSKSALFPNGSTVNKLVDTTVVSSLSTAWTQAMGDLAIPAGAGSQLYIAVRSVNTQGAPSDISNGVLLTVN